MSVLGDVQANDATYRVSQSRTRQRYDSRYPKKARRTAIRFTGVEPLSVTGMRRLDFQGVLNVGDDSLTVGSATPINLDVLTQLSGGTIVSDNVLTLGMGESLIGFGEIQSRFSGQLASFISATGELTIGDANAVDGF